MLDPHQLLLFIPVAALFTLAPGPDSILLIARSLGQGRLAGALTTHDLMQAKVI